MQTHLQVRLHFDCRCEQLLRCSVGWRGPLGRCGWSLGAQQLRPHGSVFRLAHRTKQSSLASQASSTPRGFQAVRPSPNSLQLQPNPSQPKASPGEAPYISTSLMTSARRLRLADAPQPMAGSQTLGHLKGDFLGHGDHCRRELRNASMLSGFGSGTA